MFSVNRYNFRVHCRMMLVFIDESGDPGLRINEGSSRYFTVALVVFEDPEDATACDQRIGLLKRELGWCDGEFHFQRNSHRIRQSFLQAVAPYDFFYYGIIINKDPKKLWGDGFRDTQSFYKYACGLVFENAKEKLQNATVVIDESGSLDFKRQLERYIKRRMNQANGSKVIHKMKMQRSKANNLLQLADYVAGTLNYSVRAKGKYGDEYRRIISHREINVQMWPR